MAALRKAGLFKKVGAVSANRKEVVMNGDCLSDEDIIAYLGNELKEAEKEQVDAHFGTCYTCVERKEVFKKTIQAVDEVLRTPEGIRIVQKALKEMAEEKGEKRYPKE